MDKLTLNIITFGLAVVAIVVFIFTLNSMVLGLALLFTLMFVIDSGWYFIKKFFIKKGIEAIGGSYGSHNDSRINK